MTAIDPREFSGKRVLVTGGTKGAGKAIAERFLQGGATVAITARSVPTEKTPAHYIQADVSTSQGTSKVIHEILDRFKSRLRRHEHSPIVAWFGFLRPFAQVCTTFSARPSRAAGINRTGVPPGVSGSVSYSRADRVWVDSELLPRIEGCRSAPMAFQRSGPAQMPQV